MEITKKTYPPSWVVMQNNIQECFKSMSIDEKRLLILASPIARTTNATEKNSIIITANKFAQECDLKEHSAYKSLKTASKALVKRYFCYLDERGDKTYCNWVIRAKYVDGAVSIYFPEEVLFMLKEFDKFNPYTKYKQEIILKLKKDYSFDFYHLAKKHQVMGSFQISIDNLFEQLGLPESYRRINNLKSRAIEPSLEEITENTDIDLSYENVKHGRSVVGFKFTVKEKPKLKNIEIARNQNTSDMFCKLTNSQIKTYSSILSKVHSISDLANNKDYLEFSIWIATILRDPKSVREATAKRIFKALRTETDFNT